MRRHADSRPGSIHPGCPSEGTLFPSRRNKYWWRRRWRFHPHNPRYCATLAGNDACPHDGRPEHITGALQMSELNVGKLADDLQTLVSDAEELLRATAGVAGEKASEARDRAEESLRAVRSR